MQIGSDTNGLYKINTGVVVRVERHVVQSAFKQERHQNPQ